MKGKYITTQILLACLSTKRVIKKDIHEQLKETIAERRRMMRQMDTFLPVTANVHADEQLSEAA